MLQLFLNTCITKLSVTIKLDNKHIIKFKGNRFFILFLFFFDNTTHYVSDTYFNYIISFKYSNHSCQVLRYKVWNILPIFFFVTLTKSIRSFTMWILQFEFCKLSGRLSMTKQKPNN